MNPRISVIIPVYNAEEYITKCLDSVMQQTIDSLEIICINDGSTDQSLMILKKYKEMYNEVGNRKIIVINQENAGPSAARNKGILEAKGDYIAFVDSDDYIETTMYEELVGRAIKNNLDVVLCSICNHYPDGKSEEYCYLVDTDCILNRDYLLRNVCPMLMEENVFGGPCNRIYKRKFIIENDIRMPENLGYGEDCVFQMHIFDKLESLWIDSRPFYHYVHRNEGQSHAKVGRFQDTLEVLYTIRCEYSFRWALDCTSVANYFVYCAIMDLMATVKSRCYSRKVNYLRYFFFNSSLKDAISISSIGKNQYTNKIYFIYKLLKIYFGCKA